MNAGNVVRGGAAIGTMIGTSLVASRAMSQLVTGDALEVSRPGALIAGASAAVGVLAGARYGVLLREAGQGAFWGGAIGAVFGAVEGRSKPAGPAAPAATPHRPAHQQQRPQQPHAPANTPPGAPPLLPPPPVPTDSGDTPWGGDPGIYGPPGADIDPGIQGPPPPVMDQGIYGPGGEPSIMPPGQPRAGFDIRQLPAFRDIAA